MKILHTSDWHLGRSLHGRKRYAEFEAFLDWLVALIRSEGVDVLLLAGDVFDTSTPSNRAQELYYRFLCRVADSGCRHVVVIAGNHDSPSFLDAPKELLRFLNVHVVGAVLDSIGKEVLVLENESDSPEVIVCAVPYLRDRDIRTIEAGESIEDKNHKLIEGIRAHYVEVCRIARERLAVLAKPVPIVAMGHLFTAGGRTDEGDGVRELYVGSLAHVSEAVFPESIDYLALGHLHVPQKVGKSDRLRYSGSPIPMSFGEALQTKQVILVEFTDRTPLIREITIPRFQKLEKITGEMQTIVSRIETLKADGSNAWLEIEYNGAEHLGNLRELLEAAAAGSSLEILRIRNKTVTDQAMSQSTDDETLDELSEHEVFVRCLDAYAIPEDQRPALIQAYQETLVSLNEADHNSE